MIRRLRRVYVWELPVRIGHWLMALSIVALIITGILIGNPIAIQSQAEANQSFWFGTVRFIHFLSAYVLLGVIIFRVYWAFAGNKYASWRALIPRNSRFWRRIGKVLKTDIFLMKGHYECIGHNALAGVSYFILFLLILLMFITGFGMYADMTTWWLPKSFIWVQDLFGGDYAVREIHHLTMWLFVVFIIIHLYLVLYHDQFEARGETSSMMNGYKFVEVEVFDSPDVKGEEVVEEIVE